jgi:hypothetical protein
MRCICIGASSLHRFVGRNPRRDCKAAVASVKSLYEVVAVLAEAKRYSTAAKKLFTCDASLKLTQANACDPNFTMLCIQRHKFRNLVTI